MNHSQYQQGSKPAHKLKKEIYTYEAPWMIYGLGWSVREDKPYRLAIGSFIEEYANQVEIVQFSEGENTFKKIASFEHPYPTTKIQWFPSTNTSNEDLLATTGDYLRLWSVRDDGSVQKRHAFNNNSNADFCAPLTSFDWNSDDPTIIGTSSIDTTCTIWDVVTGKTKTQLIAHDKEVYDIAFAKAKDIFASVGADGSVRMFDLRRLEHSTIIYESQDLTPLLRVGWNKQDPNYLATIMMDSPRVVILDIRVPSLPVAELGPNSGHTKSVNSIAWAPHSSRHISTAGDDCDALIWDLSSLPKPIEDPILAYRAEAEVNQLQWSALQTEWISICFDTKMQILRV
ncbi:DDB1- and CUL4-associated factor 7 [Acrasis kona]|uniref:DDB1- and CUL4-associated factor 7 n=1 Tax=Acrasis kona TaxID=1008807 RepID=A0AAW2YM44_9EUKA